MPLELSSLNQMSEEAFTQTLAGVFEHSAWIAQKAYAQRPFASRGALHKAMGQVLLESSIDSQLKLIRAHPDLAGKAARVGDLTEASRGEQQGAGLDQLSVTEYDRFQRLNAQYTSTFGFPFILAVKGHNKHSILAAFEARLKNDSVSERHTALAEIMKIAQFRLEDLMV